MDDKPAGPAVIEVKDLVVEYGKGAKAHRAVDGISFSVSEGECVGFIGANGAGKSTTMKCIMGFVFPKAGSIRLLGEPAGQAASRDRVGYLPEVALYYPFMKARELLELYGGLHGLSRADLKHRIPPLLERVGLAGRGEALLKSFSKGMQQRLGIAQAIIADPDVMIFDELSSGLDPLGRHDLRDVLLELKQKGRTIFFSSHELTEVEALCDRVIMIHKGRVVAQAPTESLLKPLNQFEIIFRVRDEASLPESVQHHQPTRDGELFTVLINDAGDYAAALATLAESGATVVSTSSKRQDLEEFFIDLVKKTGTTP